MECGDYRKELKKFWFENNHSFKVEEAKVFTSEIVRIMATDFKHEFLEW